MSLYLGKEYLTRYLTYNRFNLSYREFLIKHHDIIFISSLSFISSLPFSNWKTFDDYWAIKFLEEAKFLMINKVILKMSTFDVLKEKINTERLQHEKYFQAYWCEVIKQYRKDNLIPGAIYKKNTIKKTNTKDNIKPDLLFCYDILYELENDPHAYPFYKYINSNYFNVTINQPIDLFTINLKLENNQYLNAEEFKKDIHLMFDNCFISNDDESDIYISGRELEDVFNKLWYIYQIEQKQENSN
ncbi:unnamed protein product [Rhizophagus irregularis]|uniref:Bromo domain-containing protein n=4 Tax=Rhizophagus irregularis TaxID=588596 RepID=A0A915YV32_9GLOM|nr:unnamed protein product [Rhizophagus irregularis]CAB5342608.1 unnamed protein product [Rhizophagus irregularis]